MSSQGLNSTTYSGFRFVSPGGIPSGFPVRDSSDYTNLLKQRIIYQGLRGNTGRTDVSLLQGNDIRLDYNFGRIGCTGCSGPFPSNVVGT